MKGEERCRGSGAPPQPQAAGDEGDKKRDEHHQCASRDVVRERVQAEWDAQDAEPHEEELAGYAAFEAPEIA